VQDVVGAGAPGPDETAAGEVLSDRRDALHGEEKLDRGGTAERGPERGPGLRPARRHWGLLRPLLIVASLALPSAPAFAQLVLPGAPRSSQPGAPVPPGNVPGGAPPPAAVPNLPPSAIPQGAIPAGPPAGTQARPPAPRPPTEDKALARNLLQNGEAGLIRVERRGKGTGPSGAAASTLVARVILNGRGIVDPTETCRVELGAGQWLPLSPLGRPAGVPRYMLEAPACPLLVDMLDEAVFVGGPAAGCEFRAADCRIDPTGMWGPDAASLTPRAREIERERSRADAALRDTWKLLTDRGRSGADQRATTAEQAGFPAERDTMCRDYDGEDVHGFCHTRYTQMRAAGLRTRLSTQ
jgi:hypothetical protein